MRIICQQKSHTTITRYQKDKLSEATSSLFPQKPDNLNTYSLEIYGTNLIIGLSIV